MRPGLTLLCMTRDQAGKLLRMIESVKGVVDAMIIVDTGSRDLSPGIAKMHGATVVDCPWADNFSEPLNVGLGLVETEWVLRLDSDEWLDPGQATSIRAALENEQAFAYRLLRRDLSDESHFSEAYHLRLWRHHPALKFEGWIHEHFDSSLLDRVAGDRLVVNSNLWFWHDGFLGGISADKHRRNLKLLELQLATHPDDLYYQIERATTLQALGDPEATLQVGNIAERLLAEPALVQQTPLTANLLAAALANLSRRELRTERAEALAGLALDAYGDCPPMLWALAYFEMRRGDRTRQLDYLRQLKRLASSGASRREWLFDQSILGESLDRWIDDAEEAQGQEKASTVKSR